MIPLHSYRWQTRQAFRTAVPGEQELYQRVSVDEGVVAGTAVVAEGGDAGEGGAGATAGGVAGFGGGAAGFGGAGFSGLMPFSHAGPE